MLQHSAKLLLYNVFLFLCLVSCGRFKQHKVRLLATFRRLARGVMQTSFTMSSVNKFLKTAEVKDVIYCTRIRGELRGLAHSTIKRAYGALKTMLNHALLNDAINTNPLAKINISPAPASELEHNTSNTHTIP